jgi:phosphoribosylanthranilate isomerase
MIQVKICGITRPEDAALAVELGARAIGLVFWPESPRVVDRVRAREIVSALPSDVDAVGVFVNQTDEAVEIAHEAGLRGIQLHGDESPDSYRALASAGNGGISVIKAVAVRDESDVRRALDVPDGAKVLLDAHDAVKRGGTGRTIDWSLAAAIARQRPVILSGGLNAGNVIEAIEAVHPAAIDVSSGVESAPGRKDSAKLRSLFDILRHSSLAAIRHSSFGM